MLVSLDGNPVGEGEIDTQPPRYATTDPVSDHPVPADSDPVIGSEPDRAWSTRHVLVVAVVAVIGAWTADVAIAFASATAIGALLVVVRVNRAWTLALVSLVVCLAGAVRSEQSWASLAPDAIGPYHGWARMVDDPQPYAGSTRVILSVEGERFEVWTRGRARRQRVSEWRGGEWVAVSGTRTPLDAERAHRVAWQHVVGEFELDWASDVDAGDPVARASNRVRMAIEKASRSLPADDGALFRGLVVGDDRDQPPAMIDRFRASGLSHLTAVSGQNVSFMLAAAGPLLRRLRPWLRWVVTAGLIAWFVALTRYEPSIVRAGAMAGLSATAFVLGRDRSPVRILGVAVTGLVLVDPLLVWSVGFWLSVGATLGVSAAGPWIATRLERFDPTGLVALPLGVTLGAQLGVAVPSVMVFGRLPLVSIPANLLAIPVAGAVMLYGLPAGLVAGWIPPASPVLMFPARLGTRWVDTVATLGARLEPGPRMQLVGWGVIVVVVVALLAISRHTAARHGDLPADR